MATKVKAERSKLREAFKNRCAMCGTGPLLRKALHVVDDRRFSDAAVPMCLHCRNLMQSADLDEAVFREAKRLAKAFDRLADVAVRARLKRFPMPPSGIVDEG